MPLRWRNQIWQSLEEGAGKRCSDFGGRCRKVMLGFWRKVPESGTDCGTPVGDLLRLSVFSLQKLAYGYCQFVTLPYTVSDNSEKAKTIATVQ